MHPPVKLRLYYGVMVIGSVFKMASQESASKRWKLSSISVMVSMPLSRISSSKKVSLSNAFFPGTMSQEKVGSTMPFYLLCG